MTVSREPGWIRGLALLSGFLYLLLAMFLPPKRFDEGIVVVGAERILHGAIPYRDFAAYYAPGQFYTLAAVFHFFGSFLLAERIWETVVRFSLCVVVFLVARALVSGRWAYLPYCVVVLFFGWCWFFGYPVVPAMLCALVGVLLLVRGWPENRPRNLLLAGIAMGLSAFYRQDVGAYAIASGVVALAMMGSGRADEAARWRASLVAGLRPLAWFALGACLALAPAAAYFVRKLSIAALYADFMVLPRLQLRYRHLPLPSVIPTWRELVAGMGLADNWFLFYVPIGVFLATAAKLVGRSFRPTGEGRAGRGRFAALLLTLFGLLLVITAITRVDILHCLAPTIPAAILFAALLAEWPRRRAWSVQALAICLVVLSVPYVLSPVYRWGLGLKLYPPWSGTSSLPRARFSHVPADQEAAAEYVRSHAPTGSPIFVANSQNQRVAGDDAMFYFLADRPVGTRYEEFEPGVVTKPSVQREIVGELERNHVDWVVLYSGFEASARGLPGPREGSTVLDDFLAGHYEGVARFGRYSILRKRP